MKIFSKIKKYLYSLKARHDYYVRKYEFILWIIFIIPCVILALASYYGVKITGFYKNFLIIIFLFPLLLFSIKDNNFIDFIFLRFLRFFGK